MPRFEIAQLVSWNTDTDARHLANMKKRHGEGPFRVHTVKDVAVYCNCGALEAGHTDHATECNLDQVEPRPQQVTIRTKQGWRQFAECWLIPAS